VIDVTDAEMFCDCEEQPESWRTLYYQHREAAFEAVRAADVLGIGFKLRVHWSEYDLDGEPLGEKGWALDLLTELTLPETAIGSVSLVL
jgi:hypothetical protein